MSPFLYRTRDSRLLRAPAAWPDTPPGIPRLVDEAVIDRRISLLFQAEPDVWLGTTTGTASAEASATLCRTGSTRSGTPIVPLKFSAEPIALRGSASVFHLFGKTRDQTAKCKSKA
jgi:hypothetical protein